MVLVIIESRITWSLVARGISPLGYIQSEKITSVLEACFLLKRKIEAQFKVQDEPPI